MIVHTVLLLKLCAVVPFCVTVFRNHDHRVERRDAFIHGFPQAGDKHATSDTTHGQTGSGNQRKLTLATAVVCGGVGASRGEQEGVQPLAEGFTC